MREVSTSLAHVLSPEEAERARGFRFERAREAFVAAHSALRAVLGAHTGVAPEDVAFRYGPQGKPEIDGASFNVSHAGDVALVAVGEGRIGVDVEEMRPGVEMRALARRFFTPAENAALDALPDDELVRGFYGCWTQKEAFVKAVGEGVSFGLGRVEVAVHPARAGLVSLDGDAGAAAHWTLAAVDVGAGYAAAIAVDAPGVRPVVREWNASAAA